MRSPACSELVPFNPQFIQLLVVVGSPEYKLFLVALRDKLRMRVFASPAARRQTGGRDTRDAEEIKGTIDLHILNPYLVRGAQILHALASASRPVWIQVSRKSLDVGPESKCTEGLPSSDLTPKTLRDLHLPYSAEWVGWGCFNHGVYRFQFALESELVIEVDCKPLCVHAAKDGKTQFAHACLDGEHEVRVRLCAWTCSQDPRRRRLLR